MFRRILQQLITSWNLHRQSSKTNGKTVASPQKLPSIFIEFDEVCTSALIYTHSIVQNIVRDFSTTIISFLQRKHIGGIDSLEVAQFFFDQGAISQDIVLMCDEMYPQKGTEFHDGDYVGADGDQNLFNGIIVFIFTGMKKKTSMLCFRQLQKMTSMENGYLMGQLNA